MRRTLTTAVVLALVLSGIPGTAAAWCNGPTKNGQVGAGYGSHDWILDQAIKQAGPAGAWVRRSTALLATDDPDSQKWGARVDHFYETGSMRGAPQAVSDLYHKAVTAYRAGDMTAASRYLGQLSHCYSDITQPFHSTKAASGIGSIHTRYEYAVDDRQNISTKSLSWITARPRFPVGDIRTKTIDAAVYARSFYPSLLSSYRASGSVGSGTPLRITKTVMTRAVNDLADIIASIPTGTGEATAAASVTMGLSRTNPRPNEKVGAWVRVADASGRPIDAVGVTFVWKLASETVTWLTYTDASGYVSRYQNIGDAPIGKPLSVTTIITVNGVTTANTRSFVPALR